MLAALLLLADLEITSVAPAKDVLITDEPFRIAVRVRNHGPAEAKDVKVKVGVNALTFMNDLVAPKGWTCEQGPLFGYALSCSTPSLAAEADAELSVTFASPQHSAIPYRIGASVRSSTDDAVTANNMREKVLSVVSSRTNAELSLTASARANQAKVEVRNAGPHDAREVMVVLNEANRLALAASGDGWKCKSLAAGVICTRALLRAGTSATLTAQTAAPPPDTKATIHARVRADRVREAVIKDNGAKVTLP